MCWMSWNLGDSTSWIPQGLSRPVRDCFTFTTHHAVCHCNTSMWKWGSDNWCQQQGIKLSNIPSIMRKKKKKKKIICLLLSTCYCIQLVRCNVHITSHPILRRKPCSSLDKPPTTTTVLMPSGCPNLLVSSSICWASSRVGARMMEYGPCNRNPSIKGLVQEPITVQISRGNGFKNLPQLPTIKKQCMYSPLKYVEIWSVRHADVKEP